MLNSVARARLSTSPFYSIQLLEGMHTHAAFCPQLVTGFIRFYSNTFASSSAPQSSGTASTPASATTSTASASVIVFGFPPYLYHDIVQHFTSIGETVSIDPAPSPETGRNWITIVYKNPWEAARAVRRSGEILTLGREECMIGVKWAVSTCSSHICLYFARITKSFIAPARFQDNNGSISEVREFAGSPPSEVQTPSRPSISSGTIGRPVTLAPSRTAFKQHHPGAAAVAAGGATNEWGVALRNQTSAPGTVSGGVNAGASGGIWNKMSDLVFGW